MSSMKGGFSTLNRWFGRKKDKSGVGNAASNGKLSKSTTQLHHMSTDGGIPSMHINEASQLDYNRITPLPVATSNAPFEQTFRITVLLPKDQLYVARLGARVPLSKLLSLVCENKQLDADKYEFRNPDASQVYSCELTIGAVGLSEIRLCHKTESYDSFNADSMPKFQRTAGTRDSLSSSSDFSSSRHSQSKLTAKTPSPYSSSNSLNSMDSTGMNYTRTPVVPPKALSVAPPPRKKRVAPRPPSQTVIPEQSVPQYTPTSINAGVVNGGGSGNGNGEPAYAVIVKRPQLCMSTPNLASTPEMELETEKEKELDCNGNSAKLTPDSIDGGHYATLEIKSNGVTSALPEPTPRKRLIQIKKKTAPAPPPDTFNMSADTISLSSTTASITELAMQTPQPAPRITTPTPNTAVTPIVESEVVTSTATAGVTAAAIIAAPELTPTVTPTATPTATSPPPLPSSAVPQLVSNQAVQNVSKVLLNRTPTPEPRSLGSGTEDEDNNDAVSKQADSGIGEPLPSPPPSSSSSSSPSPSPEPEVEPERKSQLESSSDDDEAIKVYNFKTSCQTSVKTEKPLPLRPTTLAELNVMTASQPDTEDNEQASPPTGTATSPSSASELTSLSSWNYAVPISPPPDFSDTRAKGNPASSPLDDIVDELSTIIHQQRLGTLIRQVPEQTNIEAAKPNRLTNFTIAAIANGSENANGTARSRSSTSTTPTTPTRVTRADSFEATTQSPRHSLNAAGGGVGLRIRSSSQLSLNKIDHNGNGLNQRRSSSELSIAESPSLQSLELIKTILSNSRKNSLADSPDAGKPATVTKLEPFEKPKSSSSASPSPCRSPIAATTPTTPLNSPVKGSPIRITQVDQMSSQSPSPIPSPTPTPTASPVPDSSFTDLKPLPETLTKSIPQSTHVTTPASSPNYPGPAAAPAPAPAPSPAPIVAPAAVTVAISKAEVEAKPVPSTYRYSGPPSINFATWSERPKSHVAIKNEGDYIFGGASTTAGATSLPVPSAKPAATVTSDAAKLTIEVASPILRMGIPRKEYHVPITVKPLRDVSQEREREREREKPQQDHLGQKQQQAEQVDMRQPIIEQVKPSTLPRPAKSNRFTLPAQMQSSITTSTMVTTATTATLVSVSNSTNSLPRPKSTLEKAPQEPVAAPFGQNTLRRTGFKERMLAREQQEHEEALRVRVSVNEASATVGGATTSTLKTTAAPPPTIVNTRGEPAARPAAPSAKPIIRSSKLELTLQHRPEPEPLLQVKLRPTSQITVNSKAVTTTTTTTAMPSPSPPPPAPPAPPALAKAKPMRNVGSVSPATTVDPRSQLLEAIRNFKRDELNRA